MHHQDRAGNESAESRKAKTKMSTVDTQLRWRGGMHGGGLGRREDCLRKSNCNSLHISLFPFIYAHFCLHFYGKKVIVVQ